MNWLKSIIIQILFSFISYPHFLLSPCLNVGIDDLFIDLTFSCPPLFILSYPIIPTKMLSIYLSSLGRDISSHPHPSFLPSLFCVQHAFRHERSSPSLSTDLSILDDSLYASFHPYIHLSLLPSIPPYHPSLLLLSLSLLSIHPYIHTCLHTSLVTIHSSIHPSFLPSLLPCIPPLSFGEEDW